ncbi:MAG: hypothetical protein UET87_05865, partial [Oscillospiraceae bacterium]|nr:hypothetical protein [Oscillospiraceae bacterium]
LTPLARLDYDALSEAISRLELEKEEARTGIEIRNQELVARIISGRVQAYILDKAAQCGVSLADAQVTLHWSTDGYWYPYAVRLVTSGAAENSRLAQTIEADLGIPRARQEWSSAS